MRCTPCFLLVLAGLVGCRVADTEEMVVLASDAGGGADAGPANQLDASPSDVPDAAKNCLLSSKQPASDSVVELGSATRIQLSVSCEGIPTVARADDDSISVHTWQATDWQASFFEDSQGPYHGLALSTGEHRPVTVAYRRGLEGLFTATAPGFSAVVFDSEPSTGLEPSYHDDDSVLRLIYGRILNDGSHTLHYWEQEAQQWQHFNVWAVPGTRPLSPIFAKGFQQQRALLYTAWSSSDGYALWRAEQRTAEQWGHLKLDLVYNSEVARLTASTPAVDGTHVVYTSSGDFGNELLYGLWNGYEMSESALLADEEAGFGGLSIAVTNDGTRYAAYSTPTKIVLMTKTPTTWARETIANTVAAGAVDLRVDEHGFAHVAFIDNSRALYLRHSLN